MFKLVYFACGANIQHLENMMETGLNVTHRWGSGSLEQNVLAILVGATCHVGQSHYISAPLVNCLSLDGE